MGARPALDVAAQLRLDYSTRFVASKSKPTLTPARQPICAAKPKGFSADYDNTKHFTIDDIARKPPPLDFMPHCAYVLATSLCLDTQEPDKHSTSASTPQHAESTCLSLPTPEQDHQ